MSPGADQGRLIQRFVTFLSDVEKSLIFDVALGAQKSHIWQILDQNLFTGANPMRIPDVTFLILSPTSVSASSLDRFLMHFWIHFGSISDPSLDLLPSFLHTFVDFDFVLNLSLPCSFSEFSLEFA